MNTHFVRATLAAGLALILTGCVTQGTYQKKEDEARALTGSLQTLQQQYDSLTAENGVLKSRLDKLQATADRVTTDRDKLAADKKELEQVLTAKSDTLSRNITDLRQKIADLETDNGRLRDEIATLQKSREEAVQKTSKTYEDLLDKMKQEISQGQVTISELKGKLTVNMVDAVLFDSGRSEVKPEGLQVLQKVVDILKGVKDKAIRIEGHTDNVQIIGGLARRFPSNWELSAARAITVTRFLQEQGVDPAALAAVAYGEYKPVAGNDTDEGKARNRRIEIILAPKE